MTPRTTRTLAVLALTGWLVCLGVVNGVFAGPFTDEQYPDAATARAAYDTECTRQGLRGGLIGGSSNVGPHATGHADFAISGGKRVVRWRACEAECIPEQEVLW